LIITHTHIRQSVLLDVMEDVSIIYVAHFAILFRNLPQQDPAKKQNSVSRRSGSSYINPASPHNIMMGSTSPSSHCPYLVIVGKFPEVKVYSARTVLPRATRAYSCGQGMSGKHYYYPHSKHVGRTLFHLFTHNGHGLGGAGGE